MTVNTDQARTADNVMACPPVTASLGMRLIGDEEVATITLTQHDQAVILHCADQAHAARIAAAIEALPAAPAVQGEPDVTALVEALSESLKGIKIPSVLTPARAEFFKAGVHAAVNQLNTVLAAHRKQGGEV